MTGAHVQEFIPFARPYIGDEEVEAVSQVLRSGWLTTGPQCKEFEAQFAKRLGVRHAVALNSCTAALHLAVEALGVTRGDSVFVPTLTFAATAEILRYLDARPILIDCQPDTMNLDPLAILRWIEAHGEVQGGRLIDRTSGSPVKGIIPVHYGGLMCDMPALGRIAEEFGLFILEDAAHALPCRQDGRDAGTIGRMGAFSFYANKTLSTGEGGMLITNDDALADRARIMSLHGISRDAWKRFTAEGSWYYEIVAPGYKYNMTDIAAAMGLAQLARVDWLRDERARIAARNNEAFEGEPAIETPVDAPEGDLHAWHLYPLRLRLDQLTLDRAQFIEELKALGIGTSVHYLPLHMHPYYREHFGACPDDLPVAAGLYPRIITLPIYPGLTESELSRVVDGTLALCRRYRR